MKADELVSHFDRIYGINKRPLTYEVDSDTYANCCQAVFDELVKINRNRNINVYLGDNKGLMFKGVELLLAGHKSK